MKEVTQQQREREERRKKFEDVLDNAVRRSNCLLNLSWHEIGWVIDEILPNLESEVARAVREEREKFSGWIAEGCAEADTLVGLAKFLRKKLTLLSPENNDNSN